MVKQPSNFLKVYCLVCVSTIKSPQYCTVLIFINFDNKTFEVTPHFIHTKEQEEFRSDGRSLAMELCDRCFQMTH